MAAGKGTITEFLNYLRKLTYARKSSKALTLSSVHMSKGLEYDYVYFVGLNQGTVPHVDGEIAEESRIFFVGASRAGKELHMSYFKSLSQFLMNYQDRVVSSEELDGPVIRQY
jgi:superfamily I DNA/RNA helicase